MPTAALAAVGAAALFAIAAALQHRSAGLVTEDPAAGTTRGFVSRTLRHPLWIGGLVADVGGFGLHALALRTGALSLVQPLLVSSLVFALALRQILEGLRPKWSELAWATALGVGLVLFLVDATPTNARTQPADTLPAVVAGGVLALAVLACIGAGRRRSGGSAAILLGVATGLAFAASAALLKATMDVLSHGVGALLVSWQPYALVAVGATGLLLNQLAFQVGPLRLSLPAITVVDPVASLLIGVIVFDEHLRGGATALSFEVLGMVLVVAAAGALSRSRREARDQDQLDAGVWGSRSSSMVTEKRPSSESATGMTWAESMVAPPSASAPMIPSSVDPWSRAPASSALLSVARASSES